MNMFMLQIKKSWVCQISNTTQLTFSVDIIRSNFWKIQKFELQHLMWDNKHYKSKWSRHFSHVLCLIASQKRLITSWSGKRVCLLWQETAVESMYIKQILWLEMFISSQILRLHLYFCISQVASVVISFDCSLLSYFSIIVCFFCCSLTHCL